MAHYRRNACGYGTLKQTLAGNRWVKSFFDLFRAVFGVPIPIDARTWSPGFVIRIRQHLSETFNSPSTTRFVPAG